MALHFSPPLQPGIYFVEVQRCEEAYSKKEDPMLTLVFVALDHKKEKLCQDTIMCGGAGRGMGMGKLKALGIDIEPLKKGGSINGTDLVGKRCYVNVENEIYNSRTMGPMESLKVKKAEGAPLGYWPEDSPPNGYKGVAGGEGDPLGDDDPWSRP